MEFSHALASISAYNRVRSYSIQSSSQMIANSGRYNSYEGSQPRVGDAWASHYTSKLTGSRLELPASVAALHVASVSNRDAESLFPFCGIVDADERGEGLRTTGQACGKWPLV